MRSDMVRGSAMIPIFALVLLLVSGCQRGSIVDDEMWRIQALAEKLLAGNRIRNETIHIVQDKDTQVIEVSPCRVREIARTRVIVLSPEQVREVAQRVAVHLSENVQTEIDYALASFEGGRDSA